MTFTIQSPEGQEVLAALITLAQNGDRKFKLDDALQEIPKVIPFDLDKDDIIQVLQAYTSDSQICDPKQGKILCIFMDDGKGEYRLTADEKTCEALKGVSGAYVSNDDIDRKADVVKDDLCSKNRTGGMDADAGESINNDSNGPDYDYLHSMDVYFQNGENAGIGEKPESGFENNGQSLQEQINDEERYAVLDDYAFRANFDGSDQSGNYASSSEDADNYQSYNAIKEAAGRQDSGFEDEREAEGEEPSVTAYGVPEISEQEMLLSESMTGDGMEALNAIDELNEHPAVDIDDAGYLPGENEAGAFSSADAAYDSTLESGQDSMSVAASGTQFAAEPDDPEARLEEAAAAQTERAGTNALFEEPVNTHETLMEDIDADMDVLMSNDEDKADVLNEEVLQDGQAAYTRPAKEEDFETETRDEAVARLRNTDGLQCEERADSENEESLEAPEDSGRIGPAKSVTVTGLDGDPASVWTCSRDPQASMDDDYIRVDMRDEYEDAGDMQDLKDENDKLQSKIKKAKDVIVQQERKISDHNGQIERNGSGMMKSLHESQIRHDKKVIDRKERKIGRLQDQIDRNNEQLR